VRRPGWLPVVTVGKQIMVLLRGKLKKRWAAVQQLLLRGMGEGVCRILVGEGGGWVIRPCGAVYSWSEIGIIGMSVMPFRSIDRDWWHPTGIGKTPQAERQHTASTGNTWSNSLLRQKDSTFDRFRVLVKSWHTPLSVQVRITSVSTAVHTALCKSPNSPVTVNTTPERSESLSD